MKPRGIVGCLSRKVSVIIHLDLTSLANPD